MNSRQKGKRGELEAAKFLTAEGFPSRRSQQYCGDTKGESSDVLCECLPKLHFEVKRTERGNPYDWIAQAKRDAGEKLPVVMHRRNDSEWLAVLPAETFLVILRNSNFVE